jgi:hypothetical protein
MSQRKTREQLISKLREAELALPKGETVGQVCLRQNRRRSTNRYV